MSGTTGKVHLFSFLFLTLRMFHFKLLNLLLKGDDFCGCGITRVYFRNQAVVFQC